MDGRVYAARLSGVGDLRFLRKRERVKEAGIVEEFLSPSARDGDISISSSLSSSIPLNGDPIERNLPVCSVLEDLVVDFSDIFMP